ncbi:UNVERIFIED_CONTAM: multisubunit sodium/proton antiporter MrpD subunit [Acetivibrio alkalicellulosi]
MINLYFFVLLPILTAVLIYLFSKKYMKNLALLVQLFFLVATVVNFNYVKKHGTIIETIGGWTNYTGISLKMDLLASVMVMLVAFLFLAFLIFDYPKKYVNKLFLLLFLILQALITGIILSNDLFNIYVLVEVSTIVVAILIMFKKDSRSLYDGIVYLLINIVAMTFFLFGVGFLYKTFGVLDLQGIKEGISLLEDTKPLILPYSMMITAAGLKSSLISLFNRLAKAHVTPSAPSIVSALLSGIYVKTGIYLFIRLQDMFSPAINTSNFFMIVGFLTGVIGFILALSQTDINLMLAYSTISQIGLIMIGINYPSEDAYWGSIYHIVNHAFFKSTLFLITGIIIEKYGTRNINKIQGVFKRMPFISIASFLAILGITGAPFFNGSFSKYLIKTALSGNPLEYGIILINLGTVLYFLKFLSIFKNGTGKTPFKIDNYRRSITIVLSFMCFIGGILGQFFVKFLFNHTVIFDFSNYFQNIILFILTLIAGLVIYKYIIPKLKWLSRIKEVELDFNNICLLITLFFIIVTLTVFFN